LRSPVNGALPNGVSTLPDSDDQAGRWTALVFIG